MSVTAVITNHDYARFLPECLKSALDYCDEVLVYDDGSTDDSLEVLAEYPVTVTHREEATGDPVWGSELGMQEARTSHLIFLDADNWLLTPPPETDADYTYSDLFLCDESSAITGKWAYPDWPLTAADALAHFIRDLVMPVPWGGVWRTAFVRDKKWTRWPSTLMGADFRTCIDWMRDDPTIAYRAMPYMVFRQHAGQWSASPERALMEQDARALRAVM